ncbi:hypothetical protein DH2020_030814 [Rehmannia glutinosa]|uniref:Glycosyltransferase n=1 Tax=Rehmannia glutinosa TaxID=99300 RepID=A0ABR0VNS6_REHGL
MPVHCLNSFRELIKKLNCSPDLPPVSCIVSDGVMSFTLKVAQEFNIPEILFFTVSACGMLGYLQFEELFQKGYFPLKDESYLSNGYLDTMIDWTPSMGTIRLRDLPTFIRTTNGDDLMFNYNLESVNNALKTGNLILNTFDDLEQEVLNILKTKFQNIYTIGPLSLLCQQNCEAKLESLESSLWKEDEKCLEWLDGKEPKSVLYVNYGSLVIMSPKQLSEFAWGLANSKCTFLWVIRPNLVDKGNEVISRDFLDEIKERGLILDWCPQEKVLGHSAVGGFLTLCGWNSTLESVSEGVPIICWPFFAEQQMNCLYICTQWGIGMEIDVDVYRGEVEGLVRELMGGEKGMEMREKVLEWKKRAEKATKAGGSSYIGFDLLVERLKGGT